MKKQHVIAFASLILTMLVSDAMALDGYRSRSGILYGLQVGGGASKTDESGDDTRFGYHVGARLGGGLNENLTLDASLNYRSDNKDDSDRSMSTLLLGGNYFIVDGLFLRGEAGLATFNRSEPNNDTSTTGYSLGAGFGYEFFVNSDLALGANGLAQFQQYDDFSVQTFGIFVSATLY